MRIKHLLALAAIAVGSSAWAQTIGDKFTYGESEYTVESNNLFTNGSFDDGVSGWKTIGYTTDALASNFTINAEGGFDGGAYIITNGGGVGSVNTIRQSVAVESGKTYYFCVYTSGKAPASNNYNYNALFKMKDSATEDGVLKAFAWPQGAEKTTTEWNKTEYVFTASTSHVGVRMGWNASSAFDGFTLVEVKKAFNITEWTNAKAAAETALAEYDAKYATTERAAVTNAMNAANPTNTSDLDSQVQALKEAVDAYKAKAANEQLMDSKKDLTDAIASILANYQNTDNNLFGTDLSKWPGSTYVANNGGEHWSGVKTNYYEQTGAQWGQNSWSIAAEKTVNLPKGKYAFVVTARASQGVTSTMTIDGTDIALSNVGAVGYGVDTNGEATYDMTKTYANGAGRGWEYAYAEFEVTEARDVTIKFTASTEAKQNWVSIANPVLYFNDEAKESLEMLSKIQEVIEYAEAVKIPTANVGTDAFQYPSDKVATANNSIDAYSGHSAAEIAQGLQKSDAMLHTNYYNLEYLNKLLVRMEEGVNEMNTLNAPAAGQKFNVVLTYAGWTYDNKAMTYIANGRTDAGLYNIQYLAEANANYAQAFTLTKVEGNKYKMSQLDNDGNERYICTGVVYGGNNAQIRTTTNADEALLVEVIADKEREGIYNLKNTEANQFIGSQDAGVFTVNSHIDFNLIEASKATATLAVSAAKYGTFIAPFAVEIPSGVTAYTVSEMNDVELVLAPATSIDANVPYIVESESPVSTDVEGWGLAKANTYTNGLLTGVYAETAVPTGSYVLQNQNNNVAFYVVSAEDPITVPANKAYLTVPASSAKVININTNATAISAIEALTSGKAEIYSVNGAKQDKLSKGVNILNVNGKTVKVLVK